jgi:hypothetical protein
MECFACNGMWMRNSASLEANKKPCLSHMYPYHILTSSFFKICFNIILPYTVRWETRGAGGVRVVVLVGWARKTNQPHYFEQQVRPYW